MKSKLVVPLSLAGSVAALFFFQVDPALSQITFQLLKAPVPGTTATDPGVRTGPAGAGGPIPGLGFTQGQLFADGLDTFNEVDDVAGGLGPRMNLDSCAGCHAHPAVGGSSPFANPQVGFATKSGGTDTVP